MALISRTLGIRPGGSLLAGFAPFALLGPALGAASVSPDMDVTQPATLTAQKLADAAIAGQSSVLFASPPPWRTWSRPPTGSTLPSARRSTPCGSCSRPAPPCTRS